MEGPILVLAAPGSGKTNVICHRLLTLLKDEHVPPQSICVMTFTKAAARSMQERFFSLLGHSESVAMGTIHGLCYRILSKHRSQPISILNELQKLDLLRSMLHRYNPNLILGDELLQKTAARLSYLANHTPLQETWYVRYQKEKERLQVMDYDDLVNQTVELLESDASIRETWQQAFSHYMVDEFQDVNAMQLRLLWLLSEQTKNVMVVGDDDQAIYGFRGSMPGIFREFENLYPGCRTCYLSTNYRSHTEIMTKAQGLISHNQGRYEKIIHGAKGKGGSVVLTNYESKEAAYEGLIHAIIQAEKDLPMGEQIGVLFRNGYQIHDFLWYAKKKGKGFGRQKKREHPLAKELLRFLRLMLDPGDVDALLAVMNHPDQGLSRFFIGKGRFSLEAYCKHVHACRQWEQENRMRRFFQQLGEAKQYGPALGVKYLLIGMNVQAFVERKEKDEDLNSIIEMANTSVTWEEFEKKLEMLLQNKDEPIREKERIVFMTMHGAKGLEYHTVFLPELIEDVLPGKKCVTIENIEEERRVLYVAMTRAKVNLHLSYYGNQASRFLREIETRGK
ncbi:DNA helicase-2 / ATP-dependent DNA helicase PcrA [Lachnospiraceae bacterium XBB1006]|nr:DNA helicase-2 / ATP-dependent DNA helicase PcrA [Lachnospiraceae bacterium XBB1006]